MPTSIVYKGFDFEVTAVFLPEPKIRIKVRPENKLDSNPLANFTGDTTSEAIDKAVRWVNFYLGLPETEEAESAVYLWLKTGK